MTSTFSTTDGGASSPANVVGTLAKGHVAARCLHIAALYGVADAIGPGPSAPEEIAARTGLDPDALNRMLRLLAAQKPAALFGLRHGLSVLGSPRGITTSASS